MFFSWKGYKVCDGEMSTEKMPRMSLFLCCDSVKYSIEEIQIFLC